MNTMQQRRESGKGNKLATIILETDEKFELFLLDLDKNEVIGRKQDVTTAVFNSTEDYIIAGMDKHEDGLVVLKADESLEEVNKINLSFGNQLHENI